MWTEGSTSRAAASAIEGRVGHVDYQVEYELGAREWRDVYLDYRQFKPVQVRAGIFKLPFGLDENTSATNLDFIYRSQISSRLAPGRDRGVSVHGRVLKNVVSYEAGVFAQRRRQREAVEQRACVRKAHVCRARADASIPGLEVPAHHPADRRGDQWHGRAARVSSGSRTHGVRRVLLRLRRVGARTPAAHGAGSAVAAGPRIRFNPNTSG